MNNHKQLRRSRLALGLVAALATAPAFAQSTAASVGGRVTGDDGAPVTGAQVTILHTASGTVSRATTDGQGRYVSRGLRVGGPYTITIQRDGYQPVVQDGVFLTIDDVQQVNAALHVAATTLEAVEVRAGRPDDVFGADRMGAASTISRDKIEGFASINRDLQDYARLDPRLAQTDKERGEISALGQNTRFNSITIDGVSVNDTFGLNANNLPTNRQPITIDAIEQLEVNVSNYDVTQTRYTGANINAVTKSGGNDFHGSLIYVYRDDSFVGDDENGNNFTGFSKEETYGGTFSGPLIEDKLFFFASYEKFEQTRAGPDVRLGNADGTAEANEVDAITPAIIDQIRSIAQNTYGFDPGNFQGLSGNIKPGSEDKLVKIDWNINDNHRASFRYDSTDQTEAIFPNLSASGRNISLDTQWYSQNIQFETFVAQLYSDWSDSFSTEAKFSYRNFDSAPAVNSRLPEVRVRVGNSNVRFGTEFSRQANELHTDTYNGYFQGDLYLGDHSLRFGVDYERNEIFNLFVQGAFGQWDFNSIADFQNNRARSFLQRSPTNGDINSAAADWTLENYGLFLQDTWQVSDNLSLMLGARWDIPRVPGQPPLNQRVLNDFGLNNTVTIDGQDIFQPRAGFNYTFDTERKMQLRGGLGLFQGAAANVWLSNPFTNNGQTLVINGCGTGGLAGCGANPPPFNADPDNQPVFLGAQPAADVDLLDKKLEQPSVWKANLAFDSELPNGWVASAEAVFTEVNKGVYYQNLNLGAPTAFGQDGRPLFYNAAGLNPARWDRFGNNPTGGASVVPTANRNPAFRNVLIAKPTNKGNGQSYTFSLQNPTSDTWYWQIAYTFQSSDEVSGLTSSTASSQWGNRATFDPNENTNATSNYETRNRITAAVSWKHFFFKDYKTEITAFYEGRSGKPYSLVFDNDANGDGRFANDLLYIPNGRGDVLFGSPEEEDAFFAFLDQHPEIARLAGQVASRNGQRSPWVNNVDIRFSQEIPGLFKGNKGEVWLDVLNVGNLIDSDWGHIDEVPFPFARGIVEFGGIDAATGKYVYRFNTPDQLSRRDRIGESRWRLQLGVRYTF